MALKRHDPVGPNGTHLFPALCETWRRCDLLLLEAREKLFLARLRDAAEKAGAGPMEKRAYRSHGGVYWRFPCLTPSHPVFTVTFTFEDEWPSLVPVGRLSIDPPQAENRLHGRQNATLLSYDDDMANAFYRIGALPFPESAS